MKNKGLGEFEEGDSRQDKYGIIITDTYNDEIQTFIQQLREFLIVKFGAATDPDSQSQVWTELIAVATGVNIFNKAQWNKSTTALLGYPFNSPEHWWSDVADQWSQENYNYLKAYADDYIAGVNRIVSSGVSQGFSIEEVTAQLTKFNKITENKARLLARDQVGKLNGLITKRRQVESGVEVYEWRTAKDERVRGNPSGTSPKAIPNHWIMEDMLCRWDNNNVYADPATDLERDANGNLTKINWKPRISDMPMTIPGQEIQCRCAGVSYWDAFIAGVDQNIEGEAA